MCRQTLIKLWMELCWFFVFKSSLKNTASHNCISYSRCCEAPLLLCVALWDNNVHQQHTHQNKVCVAVYFLHFVIANSTLHTENLLRLIMWRGSGTEVYTGRLRSHLKCIQGHYGITPDDPLISTCRSPARIKSNSRRSTNGGRVLLPRTVWIEGYQKEWKEVCE